MKTEENDIEQEWMEAESDSAPRLSSEKPSTSVGVTTEEEVDVGDLVRQIWARKRIIWITTLVIFFIGILVALVSPDEYSASVVLMPQSGDANSGVGSGLLRQFGGLSGLGLGGVNGNGTLSPDLYPEITQSTPFYLSIIEEDLYFPTLDTTISLTHYFSEIEQPSLLDYVKRYTIGLPGIIINLPAELINAAKDKPVVVPETTLLSPKNNTSPTDSLTDRPLKLTGRQRSVIGKVKSRITTTVEKNNTVMISAEMPDPLVAAEATKMATDYLTNYILEYRTDKAQQDLAFVQRQYNQKKERYNIVQRRLARFRDRNLNIISETALIEQQQLEAENRLALELYSSLAEQLAQAEIKVQEETPVFKVLEPIQVPLGKSKPDREMIIILSLFVGFFLGLGIVFIMILYGNIKHTLKA